MPPLLIGSPIPPPQPADRLDPDDLADLRRSELSDDMIAAMGCFSVEAPEIEKLTGVKVPTPGYAIPYAGLLDQTGSPYLRIRLRTPSGDMRYLSGRGDDPQLYVPTGFAELPVGDLLVVTEGEKKAAKAVQEGIPCVGIQGVYSWCDAGRRAAEKALGNPVSEDTPPIAALLDIARHYDEVLVLGDSDFHTNPKVRSALVSLAKSLSHRGIRAVAACCPPTVEVRENYDRKAKKQGLDDWLAVNRFHAVRSLPALALAAEVARDGISDSYNARMIARQFKKTLAFSRGVWHSWNGSIWQIDNVGHRRKLASKIGNSYRSYAEKLDELVRNVTASCGSNENDWPHEVKSWSAPIRTVVGLAKGAAQKIENLRTMESAFTIAQSFLSLPDDVWDRDPNLLGVRNGVVDLRTGELLPANPAHRITRMTGINYDPAAVCPAFSNFLSQVQPQEDMRLFLQTLVGYCATGHAREQKFYVFKGSGANGKGTFMNLVMEALGDYAAKGNTGILAEQDPDRPRNDLAALAGARLLSMSETSAHFKLDEGILKAITGGDMISARFLRKEFFNFRPAFTPILDTNHVPAFRDTGTSMRRRVQIVPWSVTIPEPERNERLQDHLLTELPGILTWIVRGATRYLESGLGEPQRVVEESKSTMASCDATGRWLEECAIRDPQARSKSSELYKNFCAWAGREGEIASPSWKTIAQSLVDKGYQSKKSNGLMVWHGVRIRDERDDNITVKFKDSTSPATASAWSSESDRTPVSDQKPVSLFTPTRAGGYIA
jgi:putative DNA primase/helicase